MSSPTIHTARPVTVSAAAVIAAPVEVVARCLTDYVNHHHHILPPAFSNYRVEAGGQGAGTVVAFTVTLAGRPRHYRDVITEPVPGRVIVETDAAAEKVTTFTLTPVEGGTATRVEITTTFPTQNSGPAGWIERQLAPRMLQPVYIDELARLDAYARQLAAGSVAPTA